MKARQSTASPVRPRAWALSQRVLQVHRRPDLGQGRGPDLVAIGEVNRAGLTLGGAVDQRSLGVGGGHAADVDVADDHRRVDAIVIERRKAKRAIARRSRRAVERGESWEAVLLSVAPWSETEHEVNSQTCRLDEVERNAIHAESASDVLTERCPRRDSGRRLQPKSRCR